MKRNRDTDNDRQQSARETGNRNADRMWDQQRRKSATGHAQADHRRNALDATDPQN